MGSPVAGHPRTLDSVQALRGIAASLVVLYHLATVEFFYGRTHLRLLRPFLYFGAEGVDLFFVISGFVICWSNFDSFGRRRDIPKFAARRISRIYPLYWFYLVFAIAMAGLGFSHALEAASNPWNLVGIVLLLPMELTHIVPVSWTLSFELWFYAVFGFTLLFERRWILPALAVWFGLVIIFSVDPGILGPSLLLRRITAVVVHLRTVEFMLGCLIALTLRRGVLPLPLLFIVGGTALFAAAGVRLFFTDPEVTASVWRNDLVILFGLGSASIVAGAVAAELRGGPSSVPRWLVALGDCSYSLYLSHLFAIAVARRVFDRLNGGVVASHIVWLALLAIAAFLSGVLSYRFLERPMLTSMNRVIDRTLRSHV